MECACLPFTAVLCMDVYSSSRVSALLSAYTIILVVCCQSSQPHATLAMKRTLALRNSSAMLPAGLSALSVRTDNALMVFLEHVG
jgi:hypothetical protein